MKAYIGARLVRSIKPDPEGKPYEIRDTTLKGFLLRVQPSGAMTYYAQIARGKRRKVGMSPATTPDQARNKALTLLGQVADGLDVDTEARKAKVKTLSDFLTLEYAPWAALNRKRGSDSVDRIRACFEKDLGSKKLHEITPWLIEKWRSNRLQMGRRASTLNRDIAALKAALAKAVEWGLIDQHPLATVKAARIDSKPIVRYLKPDEERRLREALDRRDDEIKTARANANDWRRARGYELMPELTYFGDHMTPLVLLSLNTGLRRGEAFTLNWADVNLDTKMLTVRGEVAKSARTRHVPLNAEAHDVLERWQTQTEAEDGLLFPSRDGLPFNNVTKAWQGLLAASEVEAFRWHDLRHTFATWLGQSGASLEVIKEALGHSTIAMTQKYRHVARREVRDALTKVPSITPPSATVVHFKKATK
ncbi:MAG: site-specific integrase [Gammaproteobacteria bacterium]|nr:site-specific integrase [Gammaproteobacteria bacterium]